MRPLPLPRFVLFAVEQRLDPIYGLYLDYVNTVLKTTQWERPRQVNPPYIQVARKPWLRLYCFVLIYFYFEGLLQAVSEKNLSRLLSLCFSFRYVRTYVP